MLVIFGRIMCTLILHGIKPRIRLRYTECGACLGVSLSPSLSASPAGGRGAGGEERLAAVLEDSEREGRLLVQWGVSRRAAPEPDWGDRGSAEVPQGRWERMKGAVSEGLWCSAHLQPIPQERAGISM